MGRKNRFLIKENWKEPKRIELSAENECLNIQLSGERKKYQLTLMKGDDYKARDYYAHIHTHTVFRFCLSFSKLFPKSFGDFRGKTRIIHPAKPNWQWQISICIVWPKRNLFEQHHHPDRAYTGKEWVSLREMWRNSFVPGWKSFIVLFLWNLYIFSNKNRINILKFKANGKTKGAVWFVTCLVWHGKTVLKWKLQNLRWIYAL
jgi:hypothetical protein